ncbi:MAG: hypothetical protein SCALA702_23260 [Melioribacteraceae bacterium]|nr:MAG: hypothetical protein SCALA702_23260 [Melioribacteraceae bacterium]
MKKFFPIFFSFLLITSFAFSQQKVYSPKKIAKPVAFDKTIPLRDMTPIPPQKRDRAWKDAAIPNQERRPSKRNNKFDNTDSQIDPVLQNFYGEELKNNIIANFDGVANLNGVYPPDPCGDIGPNHYIQMVNISFAIYNKSGEIMYGPVDNSTLWDGFPGPWSTSNDGDPIVLYDEEADRWMTSQFALPNFPSGPFYQLMAISETGDPLGSWYRYAYEFDDMPDYPKYGVWNDAYYMSINLFTSGSLGWGGTGVVAFERDKMLLGEEADMVYFETGASNDPESFLPADFDGTPPPAGAPGYFIYAAEGSSLGGQDRLEIYEFDVDWENTSNSTFTGPTQIITEPFDMDFCFSRSCIPQPGTSQGLDALSSRLMYRLQYRNFGDYEVMMANHTVDTDGSQHAGIRWYELRNYGTGWEIYQEGTYAPDSEHRWMGSIAMDAQGNIALGYTVSSSSTYPSIRYTGRSAGAPLGEMSFEEVELIAGTGSQTGSAARWGDYSCMSVDPIDGATFWFTHEYMQTTSTNDWKTRISAFAFEEDEIAPDPVTDLVVTDMTSNSLTMAWSATGDDGMTGNASGYDIRYSTTEITDANFNDAPQAVNSILPAAPGEAESFQIDGLEIGTMYYVAVKVMDNLSNFSTISNVSTGSTWQAPEIAANPESVYNELSPNSTMFDTINISNGSSHQSTLDYAVSLENNTFPENSVKVKLTPKALNIEQANESKDKPAEIFGQAIEGAGGPDLFGYQWIDSDEAGGPEYVWNDISGTGMVADNWTPTGTFSALDEGYAGPFDLGFNFKYYGEEFSQVYFGSNCFITFQEFSGNSYTNDQIPDGDSPNAIVAAIWDDMDGGNGGNVYYQAEADKFIIQYDNWGEYFGSGTFTFQVVLHKSGKIMVYYNSLTGDLTSSTVGIENPAGDDGLQVAYNAAYLADELAIQYSAEPEWMFVNHSGGTLYNGNEIDVELEFVTEELPEGMYSMDFVISSNDPVTPQKVVPVQLLVGNSGILCAGVSYDAGWNIVSVPYLADDMAATALFPAAATSAFAFDNGYVQADMLENGEGYWLKFDQSGSAQVCGSLVNDDITLNAGWNLVGVYGSPVSTANISTDPAGIIVSPFYSFNAAYQTTDLLQTGVGYWVKTSEAGMMSFSGAAAKKDVSVSQIGADWTSVTITDAKGATSTLYLSENSFSADEYLLPPAPPAGAFDARFSDDSFVAQTTGRIKFTTVNYPVKIRVNGDITRISDAFGGKFVNASVNSNKEVVISNSAVNELVIATGTVPTEYALSQNYPNPFNPSTKIEFSLPEASQVTLKVYNVLGEVVAELLNAQIDAGYHEVEFNAANLTSGIYFYKIESGSFADIKKMMLIK